MESLVTWCDNRLGLSVTKMVVFVGDRNDSNMYVFTKMLQKKGGILEMDRQTENPNTWCWQCGK